MTTLGAVCAGMREKFNELILSDGCTLTKSETLKGLDTL